LHRPHAGRRLRRHDHQRVRAHPHAGLADGVHGALRGHRLAHAPARRLPGVPQEPARRGVGRPRPSHSQGGLTYPTRPLPPPPPRRPDMPPPPARPARARRTALMAALAFRLSAALATASAQRFQTAQEVTDAMAALETPATSVATMSMTITSAAGHSLTREMH